MILIDMILYDLDFKFKVIVITESKLNTKKPPKLKYQITVKNTHQQNFINKDGMLESVFSEVLSKSQKNTIIGCIYKHPKTAIADFTQNFNLF